MSGLNIGFLRFLSHLVVSRCLVFRDAIPFTNSKVVCFGFLVALLLFFLIGKKQYRKKFL